MKTKKISDKFELKDCKELDHADCGHPDVYQSKPQHTPTPIFARSNADESGYALYRNGKCIGMMDDAEDAAFIVRAVNAHDELLQALSSLHRFVSYLKDLKPDTLWQMDCQKTIAKTGVPCSCKKGIARDNCPNCEGTGMAIDFKTIREGNKA